MPSSVTLGPHAAGTYQPIARVASSRRVDLGLDRRLPDDQAGVRAARPHRRWRNTTWIIIGWTALNAGAVLVILSAASSLGPNNVADSVSVFLFIWFIVIVLLTLIWVRDCPKGTENVHSPTRRLMSRWSGSAPGRAYGRLIDLGLRGRFVVVAATLALVYLLGLIATSKK
jgi:hypothetical protein